MTRQAYFQENGGYVETRVFERRMIPPQEEILGPAILEQADTTTVIYPGQTGRLDPTGNVIIDREGSNGG